MSTLLTNANLIYTGIGAIFLNIVLHWSLVGYEFHYLFNKFVNPEDSESESETDSILEHEVDIEVDNISDYNDSDSDVVDDEEYESDEDEYEDDDEDTETDMHPPTKCTQCQNNNEHLKVNPNMKLDFNDVLIVPKKSELISRNEVILKRTIYFHNSKRIWTGVPIAVANMDTTGTVQMARECQKYKIITCLHKFYKPKDIPDDLDRNYFMISTGTRSSDIVNCENVIEKVRPYFLCIDVANGYSISVLETIKKLHDKYPDITLVAGNVVTYEMVNKYYENGVDIVKMGIGSGSVCTTRLQTGIGYPQLSCILDTKKQIQNENMYIMSDGGIQNIGDISKAFGAGADFVMCGGMFAGHEECSGELITLDGNQYKTFYGMSSTDAMTKHYGCVANYRVAEGKCVKIKYKGHVTNTINDILGGIRSTMTYIGAKFISEMYVNTHFIRVKTIVNPIYNDNK